MAIPKHDDIRIYALKHLADNGDVKLKEFEQPLAQQFGLTGEEISQMYDSGKGPVFYDRVAWALSYLSMAKLVDKPKRGLYRINKLGVEMLTKPDEIEKFVQEQVKGRTSLKSKDESATDPVVIDSDMTPQEQLYNSFESIRLSVYDEIIDTIISKSPYEFEHLVVNLLEKMGYGGQVKDAGSVTQASNDGGIDGIIKEDVLGLGRIHIQAKRYGRTNTVGREEVQKFVGALAVAQSNKGIFITTSSYSKGAREYANNLNGSTGRCQDSCND
ncbi:restriction endonuclease [Psychromonas antarctica]|uniref:restriction endonuclease n=1 Tax=Psychromonas antarctica TaxID=67573 RepID=UPI001EE8CEB1|nr:restriction endonuclease [Psychromonas antarctica]MCG6202822.1 restriction endonuclease [Psychromonas antarctica]